MLPATSSATSASVVEGDVIVRENDFDVVVYLIDGGKVQGEVVGARIAE